MKKFHLLALVAALVVVSSSVILVLLRPSTDNHIPAEVQRVASQITQAKMTGRRLFFFRGEEYWFACHDSAFPKNHSNVVPSGEPGVPVAIKTAVDAGAIDATVLNWSWEEVGSRSHDGGEYSVVSFFNFADSQLLIRIYKSDH